MVSVQAIQNPPIQVPGAQFANAVAINPFALTGLFWFVHGKMSLLNNAFSESPVCMAWNEAMADAENNLKMAAFYAHYEE